VMRKNKDLKKIVFIVAVLIIVSLLGIFCAKILLNKSSEMNYEEKIFTIRGDSMSPLLKDGDKVKILLDYYDENEVKRDDVVLVEFSWREDPILKIIKGLPGDELEIKTSEGGFNIFINNQILTNSGGVSYITDSKGANLLGLYAKDYNGKIPDGAYLLLGDDYLGSLDSTDFGLIGKSNLKGKVIG